MIIDVDQIYVIIVRFRNQHFKFRNQMYFNCRIHIDETMLKKNIVRCQKFYIKKI